MAYCTPLVAPMIDSNSSVLVTSARQFALAQKLPVPQSVLCQTSRPARESKVEGCVVLPNATAAIDEFVGAAELVRQA